MCSFQGNTGSHSLAIGWTNISWRGKALYEVSLPMTDPGMRVRVCVCFKKFCCCPSWHTPSNKTNPPTHLTSPVFLQKPLYDVLCGIHILFLAYVKNQ